MTGKFSSSPTESSRSESSHNSKELFGGIDCGEPLLSQRIIIDFTPDEEDTDLVQKKCVMFWEFLKCTTELEALDTVPDYNVYDDTSSPTSSGVPIKPDSPENVIVKEKTAVSMLELVEGKGLIDKAFEGKLPQSYCSLGLAQYSEEDSVQNVAQRADTENGKSKKVKKRDRKISADGTVKKMCEKLEMWDAQHPKYMEPPGHSQTLIYCKKPKK
ncbi:uncharacterized protein LOC123695562 isoform X1 [Colias croceus]|uniref:uncharacterized protein LOC123695562 isoform X1 n=1 Tax=Colias crocea TaxID=72248 RepID=UPI001E28017B|nr:uncharacterized protein LOC123695562 isoform X1 [Colias croceus]